MKNNYSRLKWVALIILGGIFFFLSKAAHAATTNILFFLQQEVTGIVSDENGVPVPGVTVTVKNTRRGAVTKLDGQYEITAPANGALVFSYIGFKTFEVAIDGRSEINIQLEEDIASLGEVQINAGYYNTTARKRTGNIARVSGEEIEMQPIVSPLEALQGRMAGVEIQQRSGVPGSAPIIRIRGQNSLRNSRDDNGNLPLYIIDGVPVNSSPLGGSSLNGTTGIDPLNTLNLSNIESIEVLKDADATAIYGSRGANGVILISTKSGKSFEQKTQVEARLYSGVGEVSNKMELLNTEQYLQIRNQAFENDGLEPNQNNAYDLLVWDNYLYTDWQEELYGGTAEITDLNLSVSGGNATTSFRIGGSYHEEGTVFPGDFKYSKVTGGLNLNHRSKNEKLQLNLSLNYGVDNNNLFGSDSFISDALTLPPNAPRLYNDDGSLNWEDLTWDNPLANLQNSSNDQVNNLVTSLGISYEILEGLTFKTNAGYTNLYRNQKGITKKESFRPDIRDSREHSSSERTNIRKSWIIEPQLTYSAKIGAGNLEALVGMTFQESENDNLRISGDGYVSESLIGNLEAAESVEVTEYINIMYKYTALFARLGYNWKEKYFVNLTGRRDGSSRFAPNKRFANFAALGTAWIFSEESVVKENIPFLSFGKLRGSYGTTGSDQIPDYGFLDAYEATPGPGGLYPTQLTNPNFSWEENKKLEAALELGFLKDRINLGVSWYRNRSSNQLVGFPLPSTTGFPSIQANLPATVQNTGWEVEFSSLNISTKDFRWQTSFNFTLPETKLVEFPNISQTSYENVYRVGYPLNIALLYNYEGIDPETGLYQVQDINGDGNFSYEDRTVIEELGRQYYGGISNNLSYKNFSLQFLWQFVKQTGYDEYFSAPGFISNQPENVFQGIADGELQQASQNFTAAIPYSFARNSVHFISDASFLRLKTLGFSYKIPEELLQNWKIEGFRLFLNAQNLLTFTEYNGLNPEYPGGGSLPSLRTVTGGLQINF
ncbi:TonB-linked outer membrane protein, SusC/RagA family [Salegentibacter agarivorans]|uniref:TonB-linked outer membrane protein, SusC/RagA family n=1 Tax=Salegentibacter agarivorans TaxID=345907 RepID=A0A1I2KQN4_9FLAO|nr:SusC/RagA family TonB-linked outer membrane protein [Salegentibacter agarivorans]SFF68833.1 TonB-linked outer membrane protein, SusC/RagA family [Salegentibacter agarivorans]